MAAIMSLLKVCRASRGFIACIVAAAVLFTSGLGAVRRVCDWAISGHMFLFASENNRLTWPSSSLIRCSCGGMEVGFCGKFGHRF